MKTILFSDMKYRDKHFGYPLSVVCLNEVDPQNQTIHLKRIFKEDIAEDTVMMYRLYKWFFDFNLDKVLTTLTEIDERSNNKSVFMVSIFFIRK